MIGNQAPTFVLKNSTLLENTDEIKENKSKIAILTDLARDDFILLPKIEYAATPTSKKLLEMNYTLMPSQLVLEAF